MKSLISTIAISCLFSAPVGAQGLGEGDIFEVGIPFSAAPINFNIAQIESIQFQALATGIGMAQTNPASGDFNSLVDIANAQLIVQKSSGLVQFYIQGGYYSTPSLGTTYQRASQQTMDSFGLVPLANISFAPTSQWLLTAGKINSFGGN